MFDVAMPDLVDMAPVHLGSNAFRVPVGQQPDGEDDLVHPRRDSRSEPVGPLRLRDQAHDPTGLEGGHPVVKRPPAAADFRRGRVDAACARQPDGPHSPSDSIAFPPRWAPAARSAALRREEEKPRTLLIVMSSQTPMGVGRLSLIGRLV
jgi:hypothetical protein